MKVLFIVPYPTEGPSNRFRVEQYFPFLKKNGIEFRIRPFCGVRLYRILYKKGRYIEKIFYLCLSSLARFIDIFRSINYDIVFIHREAFPAKNYLFEWLFKLCSKRMIYDFDDSIFITKSVKVKMLLKKADRVIAGNSFLYEYALRFNRHVTILPTPIDTEKYMPRPVDQKKGNIVIGWIGTSSTSIYLLSISDVFKHLSERYKNIEFRIIGGEIIPGPAMPISKIEWSLKSEVRDLQGFDIGIMPMPDNDWTRGKCAFKVIQYMAVGIPAVASPVGMNKEVVSDGVSGYLVSANDEWREKLCKLIESSQLRQEMGSNGREIVEKRYSLRVNALKFIDVLKMGT